MTFIEVLIAITVVAVILSSILASLNFASKYARHNANKTMALNFAQALLEEIKDANYEDLESYDEYEDTVLLFQAEGINIGAERKAEVEDDEDEGDDDDFDDNDFYREITVTVSWDWQGNEYEEELNTMRYNY